MAYGQAGNENTDESTYGPCNRTGSPVDRCQTSEVDRKVGMGPWERLYDSETDEEVARANPARRHYIFSEEDNEGSSTSECGSAGEIQVSE